jgi:TonB family protein
MNGIGDSQQMAGEERVLLYRAVGASLILHLLSGVFFWRIQIPAPHLPDPSPLVVRLLPADEIPRFIDQPDAPKADGPVKSKDISQVTSEARGPGKVPGPVATPGSLGVPTPPRPPQSREAGSVARPSSAPPVSQKPATPSSPPSERMGEALRAPRPDPSSSPSAQEVRPSLREEIAALGRRGLSHEGRPFDAGRDGDAGTSERIVSLETQSSEYAPYLADVKRRIERHWEIPHYARQTGLTGKLVLVFSITPGGSLAQLEVTESSGTSVLDDAAVQAVRDAAPYAPFPPMFTFERLTIIANFRYADLGRRGRPSP